MGPKHSAGPIPLVFDGARDCSIKRNVAWPSDYFLRLDCSAGLLAKWILGTAQRIVPLGRLVNAGAMSLGRKATDSCQIEIAKKGNECRPPLASGNLAELSVSRTARRIFVGLHYTLGCTICCSHSHGPIRCGIASGGGPFAVSVRTTTKTR